MTSSNPTAPDQPLDPATFARGPASFHSGRARPELLEQPRRGEHVWISAVAYVLSDTTVKRILRDEQNVLMDGENVATIALGCYVCEEPLTERMFHRRCPGEPQP